MVRSYGWFLPTRERPSRIHSSRTVQSADELAAQIERPGRSVRHLYAVRRSVGRRPVGRARSSEEGHDRSLGNRSAVQIVQIRHHSVPVDGFQLAARDDVRKGGERRVRVRHARERHKKDDRRNRGLLIFAEEISHVLKIIQDFIVIVPLFLRKSIRKPLERNHVFSTL